MATITSKHSQLPKVKVAAAHVSSAYLNAAATTLKALQCISGAASAGANLVAFPEAYIPGFPLFAATGAPVDNEGCFAEYVEQSIYADGPEILSVREKAKECGIVVSLGFSERSRHSVGCLWNSNVVVGENGKILAHHRKLVPTFYEKLIWSPGDGYGLLVNETHRAGRVGALICGENTNPLARFSLMAQAEQIHVMCFPPAWPTARYAVGGGYDNRTANKVRAAGHSFEGKCFTILCAAYLDEETKRIVSELSGKGAPGGVEVVREVLQGARQAQTLFMGPDGVQVGDEKADEEGIVYAEFDLSRCIDGKQLHDVVGGYQRYDVFQLSVTRKRDEPVEFR